MCDGSFKILDALQRVAAAEIEEMEGLFDRINRIYKIKIVEYKEALDVGEFDGWAAAAKVGADPPRLGFACGDKRLCTAKEEALDRPGKGFLPAMIPKPYRVVICMCHPDKTLPKFQYPPARTEHQRRPGGMNPDFIILRSITLATGE